MGEPRIAALLAAIAATAVYLPIVGLLLRMLSQRHALTIFAGVAILMFAAILTAAGPLVSFWHFSAFFAGAVSLVVFCYGAVLKSLSLDMLSELSRRDREPVSLDALADGVVGRAYMARVDLLINGAAAVRIGGGYAITAQGQTTARRIRAIRRILRLESRGLYGS